MSKQKAPIIFFSVLAVLIIASFFISKQTNPSSNTRVILEHNFKTYITPICFDDSNATNFIEDATLGEAWDLGYKANGSCTEDSLKGEQDSLFVGMLKEIGILDKKWDHW